MVALMILGTEQGTFTSGFNIGPLHPLLIAGAYKASFIITPTE